MPADRLIYQVYVGPESKLYTFCTASVADYCKAHGLTHIVQREPILKIRPDPKTTGRSPNALRLGYLPIFEKANAFRHLPNYDQVAVVDADVYIRTGSPNIFDELKPEYDFGGVVERQMPLTDLYRAKIRGYSRQQYGKLADVDWRWNADGAEFMNMGVMVMNHSLTYSLCGHNPGEFIRRPEFKRFVDGVGAWKWSTDQTLLNWWLRKSDARIKQLDYRWNALYDAVRSDDIDAAHFIHFFLRDYLPKRGENVAELV
jgi:hypothetical protein